jgi:hypothetical protein
LGPLNETREFFERAVKKRRLQLRIGSGVMLVVAIVALVWGLSDPDPDRAMARMTTLGAFGFVGALVAIVVSFLPNRGLRALDDPARIVWLYAFDNQGTRYAMVGVDTGKLHRLPLPDKEADQGFALLRAVAPAATQGFSEELRVRFRSDPSSLRVAAM